MMPLDYAPPQPKPRLRRAADVALVTSLAASVSLAVSLVMYVNLRLGAGTIRMVQIALAWTSMALGLIGLVAAVLGCFTKPRTARLWLSFAVLVFYAIGLVAAFRL